MILFLKKQSKIDSISKILPWPISPNITPNKNGNVTQVKYVGLNSL